jgi:hypothetical protein
MPARSSCMFISTADLTSVVTFFGDVAREILRSGEVRPLVAD